MTILMISGDRLVASGERGPFHAMLGEFRRHWSRVDVICPHVDRPVDLTPFDNVHFHPAPASRVRRASHVVATARRLARRAPSALVVSHDYGLFLNGAGARRVRREIGIPWVSELHHVDGHPHWTSLLGAARFAIARRFVRRSLPLVAAFRVVSREVGDLLLRWGVPLDRIRLLGSVYLDLDRLQPPPPGHRDIDVLFCGRLEPEKGPWLLLDTLRMLLDRRPGVRVTIVGRGSLDAPFVRALARQGLSPVVELVRWIDDPDALARLYQRAKVLLCCSYSEGNPRVVAEAMACGAAVVTTRVGRTPEWIVHRENGMLAGWSAPELATAVIELLTDYGLREAISARAPAAVSNLGRASQIGALAAAYHAIASART